jgi:hypothetical protein
MIIIINKQQIHGKRFYEKTVTGSNSTGNGVIKKPGSDDALPGLHRGEE